jgi:hypothetical protein
VTSDGKEAPVDDETRIRGRRLAVAVLAVGLAGGWVWVRPALALVVGA